MDSTNPLRVGAGILLFIVALSVSYAWRDHSSTRDQFATEQGAQTHCPNDAVVWLNLYSGIYHFKGQRWYGATSRGAYVCQRDADKSGNRATRNGE
jgi:hypothetical protein